MSDLELVLTALLFFAAVGLPSAWLEARHHLRRRREAEARAGAALAEAELLRRELDLWRRGA